MTIKNKGFSLVEMLVTVSIVAILMTAAMGSMDYYYRNMADTRVTSLQKLFDYSIVMARSEGRNVVICPISVDSVAIDGSGVVDRPSCNSTSNWGNSGIIAFLADSTSATQATSSDDVLTSLASAGDGGQIASTENKFIIKPTGFFTTDAGALIYCRKGQFVAGIKTNMVGRVVYTDDSTDITSLSCS